MISQGDEGNADREHEGHQKIITARKFTHHDERTHRYVGNAAIKCAHTDEGKRAGIDTRITGQKCGSVAECAAYETPNREGWGEVSGAAARANRQGGGKDLDRCEQDKQFDTRPAGGKP